MRFTSTIASSRRLHLQIDLFFSQIALGDTSAAIDTIDNMFVFFRNEPDASYRARVFRGLPSLPLRIIANPIR